MRVPGPSGRRLRALALVSRQESGCLRVKPHAAKCANGPLRPRKRNRPAVRFTSKIFVRFYHHRQQVSAQRRMLPSKQVASIFLSFRISEVDTIFIVASLNLCSRHPGFRNRDPLCVTAIGNEQEFALLNGDVGINHPGSAVVQVHVRDLRNLILLCRAGEGC